MTEHQNVNPTMEQLAKKSRPSKKSQAENALELEMVGKGVSLDFLKLDFLVDGLIFWLAIIGDEKIIKWKYQAKKRLTELP